MRAVAASLAHRLFYPGVPAVLAAQSEKTVSAMPVISYAALSQRPPLIGVSGARRSFTMNLAAKSGDFSLCLLDSKHAGAVAYLASHGGSLGLDKLARAGLRHHTGRKVNAPVISDSVAALECTLKRSLRLGDHILLVGRIEGAYASADFNGYWRFRRYEPILYSGWQGGLSTYGSP